MILLQQMGLIKNNILYLSVALVFVMSLSVKAQNEFGCDFFPKDSLISQRYTETTTGGLLGDSFKTFEIKYVYQGKRDIDGRSYRVYNKYVDDAIPEVNQHVLIYCVDNSLVIGNEIYAFNREVVGELRDITKVVDFYATPIYYVSMQPTGQFYLPTVLKPKNEIGQSWTNDAELHGSLVSIVSNLVEKDVTIEINGEKYTNVYQVNQKFYNQKALISEKDIFFAKNIGMIKTVSISNILGREIKNTIELYNPDNNNMLIAEIEKDIQQLPKDSRIYKDFYRMIDLKDLLPPEDFKKFLTDFKRGLASEIDKQNEKIKREEIQAKYQKDFEQLKSSIQSNPVLKPELIGTWRELKRDVYKITFYENGTLKIFGAMRPSNTKDRYWYTITNGDILETLFERPHSISMAPMYDKYRITINNNKQITLECIETYDNDGGCYLGSIGAKREFIRQK